MTPGGIIRRMSGKFIALGLLLSVLVAAAVYVLFVYHPTSRRAAQLFVWLRDPAPDASFVIAAGSRCGSAPFVFPTTGVVGFLWDDSFQLGHTKRWTGP